VVILGFPLAMSANLRILRNQLEQYISAQLGSKYLEAKKSTTELRTINKEIAYLRKKLTALDVRKAELERTIARQRKMPL
jgi:hypothetical protein